MKNFVRALLVIVIAGCSSQQTVSVQESLLVNPITSWNFDWDDNIMYTKSPVYFFHKKTHKEVALTSEEFAQARQEVGKPGKWLEYEIDPNPTTGTYRNFREGSENYFLKYIKQTVEQSKPQKWEGPSWKKFVVALSNPKSAKYTTIITARGHSSESLNEGLKYLQQKNLIKNLPPIQNLYAVTYPGIKQTLRLQDPLPNSSELKALVMEKILDDIESHKLGNVSAKVYDREGNCCVAMHLWGFSDDDYGNFETAVNYLSAKVKAGKWPHIKLTLFYSGHMKKGVKAHAVVIKTDGSTRAQLPIEVDEAERVLAAEN